VLAPSSPTPKPHVHGHAHARSRRSSSSSSSSERTARPGSIHRPGISAPHTQLSSRAPGGSTLSQVKGHDIGEALALVGVNGSMNKARTASSIASASTSTMSVPREIYVRHPHSHSHGHSRSPDRTGTDADAAAAAKRNRRSSLRRSIQVGQSLVATAHGSAQYAVGTLVSYLPPRVRAFVQQMMDIPWLRVVPLPLVVLLLGAMLVRRRMGRVAAATATAAAAAGTAMVNGNAQNDVRARLRQVRAARIMPWVVWWLHWWAGKFAGVWKLGTTITYM
jgi:hypothetical protein